MTSAAAPCLLVLQAVESVTAALDDLFTKKRSRLARPFFEGMMRPPLSVGPLLLPLLLEHSLSARSDYLRGEAAALLAAALKVRGPLSASVGAADVTGRLICCAVTAGGFHSPGSVVYPCMPPPTVRCLLAGYPWR